MYTCKYASSLSWAACTPLCTSLECNKLSFFHIVSKPERMLESKAEQRKCGPRLHGWLGVLFTQRVLYGITLVKVLSTRIVSISSTLSLILQPNPSMSENMCGLAVRLEPDGISHQVSVRAAQRSQCSLDS